MKRRRRLTLGGRLTGRQRRRHARLLRLGLAEGDWSKFFRAPWEKRAARRLAEQGLAVVAATKLSWGVGPAKEITLFSTREAALRHFPRTVAPSCRSWSSAPANKAPKRGSIRRACRRVMRLPLPGPGERDPPMEPIPCRRATRCSRRSSRRRLRRRRLARKRRARGYDRNAIPKTPQNSDHMTPAPYHSPAKPRAP